MARNRVIGEITRDSNFEVSVKKPLDARSLVKAYADLLNSDNWVNAAGKSIAYNGMLVAVANTSDSSKNGLYFLFDPACTTSLKSPNVTLASNWIKIGETSELGDLVTRLNTIELALTNIDTRLTSLEADKVIIRRDNEYNYKKRTEPIANNEICIVDVPGFGIRVKVGTGDKLFNELPYLDEGILKNIDHLIVKGYFYQGNFYSDSEYTEKVSAITGCIYIDSPSSKLYTYNGLEFEPLQTKLPSASSTVAGIMKLYDTTGDNTDGTMNQRVITKELNDKFVENYRKGTV